jgi:hypothetical protein
VKGAVIILSYDISKYEKVVYARDAQTDMKKTQTLSSAKVRGLGATIYIR